MLKVAEPTEFCLKSEPVMVGTVINCCFPWKDRIKLLNSLIFKHLSQLIRKYLW